MKEIDELAAEITEIASLLRHNNINTMDAARRLANVVTMLEVHG